MKSPIRIIREKIIDRVSAAIGIPNAREAIEEHMRRVQWTQTDDGYTMVVRLPDPEENVEVVLDEGGRKLILVWTSSSSTTVLPDQEDAGVTRITRQVRVLYPLNAPVRIDDCNPSRREGPPAELVIKLNTLPKVKRGWWSIRP